jgi:predicted Zn-dependent protease
MAAAIRENPQSYTLLHAQCDLMRAKGRVDWALQLAKQAVNCAPSEFSTWAKLTELYTQLGKYDSVCGTETNSPRFVVLISDYLFRHFSL